MSEHTPTPWGVEPEEMDGHYKPAMVFGEFDTSEPKVICDMAARHNAEANAAFIVRACNSHEALVNALAAAFALVNDNADEFAGHVHPDKINRVVDMATEALALALARGEVPNAR